jgi:hypothetical protein
MNTPNDPLRDLLLSLAANVFMAGWPESPRLCPCRRDKWGLPVVRVRACNS